MNPELVVFALDVLLRAGRRRELCTCGREWREPNGVCTKCTTEASAARATERRARYRGRLVAVAA